MPDIIQFSSRPVASRTWKKRPGFDPDRSIEPGSYNYQSDNLQACLMKLKSQKNLVLNRFNNYLEIQLFPEPHEIDANYFRYLDQQYSLSLKKLESLGSHSRAYFYIQNIDNLIQNLQEIIIKFSRYSQEQIDAADFSDQRIKLWRYFQLSTVSTKNRVRTIEDFDSLRLKVNFIESAPEFSRIVSEAASAANLEAVLYPHGIIGIKAIRDQGAEKVSTFAEKLSQYDKIQFIKLDDFVSTIESPLQGGRLEEREYAIQQISPDAPVIAVIDSGVQRHVLTESFLTEDGLDYRYGIEDPRSGDPFIDNTGHGTSVAAEIAYGRSIEEYLIARSEEFLLPIAKIFPVRIADTAKNFSVPYDQIFDLNGYFADAVRRYGIKIVNISFASAEQKSFEDEKISEAANLMDRFAKELGVTFVVCVGNIDFEKLNNLISAEGTLKFFQRPDEYGEPMANPIFTNINIGAPSDLISGVVVGSCHPQRSKYVISTFNRSYSFNVGRNSYSKPDIVAIGGGDAPIDLDSIPARVCTSTQRVSVLSRFESFLSQQLGTSFSTPRVSRALAVALIKYPDISPEALKCLFLHKAGAYGASDKKFGMAFGTLNQQRRAVEFAEAYQGFGVLGDVNEADFFDDSNDEISFSLEGSVNHEQKVSYPVPLAAMLGDGTISKTNKMEIRISICMIPQSTTSGEVSLKSANPFHVSAFVHVNSLRPTYTMMFGRKPFPDRCVKTDSPGILLKWTSDYQVRYFPTFSTKSKLYVKDRLSRILGGDDTVTLTVRGLSESVSQTSARFAAIFSVKDLGATGEIRNRIRINV